MKSQKIISAIVLMFILFNFILSLIPVGVTRSLAADKPAGELTYDIDGIDDTLYPGYKSLIKSLQAKHGNYKFLAYYTGMDWNEVLVAEYQGHDVAPLNLFQLGTTRGGMWMCPLCTNKAYDNGSWYCASTEALAYMLDPRNSITEESVFQFKDLNSSGDVSESDIRNAVSKYDSYINNDEAIKAIVKASQDYGINGYFLVSKIFDEHGDDGSTLTAGKGYNGKYTGVYNYFNVGSYGNGSSTIIENGLAYAQNAGWTSITASIMGGAKIVKESYITKYSQNTLYYQKFNVSGRSEVGSHQYQQNIMAAEFQGNSMRKLYLGGSQEHVFIIPLYKNMPSKACARPDYTKQNSITYENGVIKNVATISVKASQNINGLEIDTLSNGDSIKILKRATTPSADGFYWDLIVSNRKGDVGGIYGYVQRYINGVECVVSLDSPSSGTNSPAVTPSGNIQKIEGTNLKTTPYANFDTIKGQYSNAVIKNKNGEVVTSGKIGTGYTVNIDGTDYTVVKKGDLTGDGDTNIFDLVSMINHIKTKNILSGPSLEAAKVKNSSDVTIFDVVHLINFMKEKVDISL